MPLTFSYMTEQRLYNMALVSGARFFYLPSCYGLWCMLFIYLPFLNNSLFVLYWSNNG